MSGDNLSRLCDSWASEARCLRLAPPRSIGRKAAVAYLVRKGALHKLDTPVPILRPVANFPGKGLTPPKFLVWNRQVPPHHREL